MHVTDLAEAHLLALQRLDAQSVTYNLGNGRGYSVLEVLGAVRDVLGREVPYVVAPRRAGDPAVLVAGSERIRRETGWAPRHGELREIVRTAAAWRQAHADGYG